MTGRDKIDAAIGYLKSRGVSGASAAPPLWRLCWRAGLPVPPPHFLLFLPLALFMGLSFWCVMSVLRMSFQLVTGTRPDWSFALTGAASGAFFGLTLAARYRWSARRLGLPPWAEFEPDFDARDDS